MNCDKFGEQLGLYWELSDNDPIKIQLKDHIRTCNDCADQFRLLDESRELIKEVMPEETADTGKESVRLDSFSSHVSEHVMKRIYQEESWRMPVTDKMYSISFKMRRNITILIAFFLALFIISFIHFAFIDTEETIPVPYGASSDVGLDEFSGLIPVASASGKVTNTNASLFDNIQGMDVASIQDPLILKIGTDPTSPDYLLIFSILGMAVTILIMNWFSRIRS